MIKLIAAIILLLLSMLVVFRAPTNFFWLAAVAVTNFPLVPILASAVLFFFGTRTERFHWPVMLISITAFIIFSLPVIAAYKQNTTVTAGMKNVFPVKNEHELPGPFIFFSMLSGNIQVPYKTFIYKTIADKKLTADFYPSSENKPAPLVIVIHGGSWQSGDAKQLPQLNSYLASKGYHVAAITYRLAPQFKAPAPVEDTRDALQYFVSHAAEYKIDTNNIFLLGRSAGGQIALSAAYGFHDAKIKGVVSFYGPADMVWGGRLNVNKLVINTDEIYTNYFGGLIDAVPEKFLESSAIDHADKTSPPTLMMHGNIDPLVFYQHEIRLQKKLNELHVPNYFLQLPFATHGCDYSLKGPAGQVSKYAVLRFLNSLTGK
jgi:acetyl esterase/lipase